MSEVKTRKQLALELLNRPKLFHEDEEQLQDLIAAQTGIRAYKGVSIIYSVDACMTLPIPKYHFWRLWSKMSGVEEDRHHAEITTADAVGQDNRNWSTHTMGLAMLKAWWSIQQDGDA